MGLKAKAIYLARQFPFIYPRKIVTSCQEWIVKQGKQRGAYFSQRGPWWKDIFPVDFLHHPAPKTLGVPNDKVFFTNQNYPTPKASLFYLQNTYLLGHKGFILSAKNELFQEFTHNFNVSSLKKLLWKNPFYTFGSGVRKISGSGAVLISPESHNYYHWLSDVLPRIKLYEPVFGQIDHFCVASNVPAKFLEILKEFGIPAEKILLVGEREKLHFDHLYVSSLPGSEGRAPKWAVDYTREKLIKADGQKPSKKIYFKRGDDVERKILNEAALIALLVNEGFEIVDPGAMSIPAQIKLMNEAAVVIGAHGAALTNLLFCPDGASVIEIFSPDYFRTDCYYTLSAILNFDYWYIVGEKSKDGKWGDMIVDQELIKQTLRHISDIEKFPKNIEQRS
ncbi:MAG TPA: glycosyltransferase family 61 protein [Mucilaginibacter sp.]|jgi:hypothetical protein|nr:glycosyltransferase family 61 protein [Mucilaginibacter sp.]